MSVRISRAGGRVRVVVERDYRSAVGPLWRALTDADRTREWFPAEVAIDARPGAELEFTLPPEALRRYGLPESAARSTGRVTAADPPRLLAYTWGEEQLTWSLTRAGTRWTRLRLEHETDEGAPGAGSPAGWLATLEALAAALAGRPWTRAEIFARADQLKQPR